MTEGRKVTMIECRIVWWKEGKGGEGEGEGGEEREDGRSFDDL